MSTPLAWLIRTFNVINGMISGKNREIHDSSYHDVIEDFASLLVTLVRLSAIFFLPGEITNLIRVPGRYEVGDFATFKSVSYSIDCRAQPLVTVFSQGSHCAIDTKRIQNKVQAPR